MMGMKRAGMAAVGKHFPGHGYVEADSHVDMPVDERTLADIKLDDLIPFERMIKYGLDGIMPAHVVYNRIDIHPAGYSSYWLKQVLRGELGFQGVIFSDDLSMEGAKVAGNVVARAKTAMRAGCDMVLVCNDSKAVEELLDNFKYQQDPVLSARLVRLHGRHKISFDQLHGDKAWHQAVKALHRLEENVTLELDFGS
jgi:beta-N-acetylhexosaminidase